MPSTLSFIFVLGLSSVVVMGNDTPCQNSSDWRPDVTWDNGEDGEDRCADNPVSFKDFSIEMCPQKVPFDDVTYQYIVEYAVSRGCCGVGKGICPENIQPEFDSLSRPSSPTLSNLDKEIKDAKIVYSNFNSLTSQVEDSYCQSRLPVFNITMDKCKAILRSYEFCFHEKCSYQDSRNFAIANGDMGPADDNDCECQDNVCPVPGVNQNLGNNLTDFPECEATCERYSKDSSCIESWSNTIVEEHDESAYSFKNYVFRKNLTVADVQKYIFSHMGYFAQNYGNVTINVDPDGKNSIVLLGSQNFGSFRLEGKGNTNSDYLVANAMNSGILRIEGGNAVIINANNLGELTADNMHKITVINAENWGELKVSGNVVVANATNWPGGSFLLESGNVAISNINNWGNMEATVDHALLNKVSNINGIINATASNVVISEANNFGTMNIKGNSDTSTGIIACNVSNHGVINIRDSSVKIYLMKSGTLNFENSGGKVVLVGGIDEGNINQVNSNIKIEKAEELTCQDLLYTNEPTQSSPEDASPSASPSNKPTALSTKAPTTMSTASATIPPSESPTMQNLAFFSKSENVGMISGIAAGVAFLFTLFFVMTILKRSNQKEIPTRATCTNAFENKTYGVTDISDGIYGDDVYTASQGTEISYELPVLSAFKQNSKKSPVDTYAALDESHKVYAGSNPTDDYETVVQYEHEHTVSQGTEIYQVPIADLNNQYETYDAVTDIGTNNPLAKKRPPSALYHIGGNSYEESTN